MKYEITIISEAFIKMKNSIVEFNESLKRLKNEIKESNLPNFCDQEQLAAECVLTNAINS